MKEKKEAEKEIEAILFLNLNAHIKKKTLRIIFNINQKELDEYIININNKYIKINSSIIIDIQKTQYIMHINNNILDNINNKINNNQISEKNTAILHIIANNSPIGLKKLKERLCGQNINNNIKTLELKKLIKVIKNKKENIIYLTNTFFKKYSIENKNEIKKKNKIKIKKEKEMKIKKNRVKLTNHKKLPMIQIIDYKNIVQIKRINVNNNNNILKEIKKSNKNDIFKTNNKIKSNNTSKPFPNCKINPETELNNNKTKKEENEFINKITKKLEKFNK